MRTSIGTSRSAPTGRMRLSSSARRSLTCRSLRISLISSRNSVPPRAATNSPSRCWCAPVNAPLAWPKSSVSINSGGIAPQLTGTNGPRRPLRSCNSRAISSLPVPVWPSISTVAGVGATRSTIGPHPADRRAIADQLHAAALPAGRRLASEAAEAASGGACLCREKPLQRFRVERARQHGGGAGAQAGAGERRIVGGGNADARHRSGALQAFDPGQHRIGRGIDLDDDAVEVAARQQALGVTDGFRELRDGQAAAAASGAAARRGRSPGPRRAMTPRQGPRSGHVHGACVLRHVDMPRGYGCDRMTQSGRHASQFVAAGSGPGAAAWQFRDNPSRAGQNGDPMTLQPRDRRQNRRIRANPSPAWSSPAGWPAAWAAWTRAWWSWLDGR